MVAIVAMGWVVALLLWFANWEIFSFIENGAAEFIIRSGILVKHSTDT